MQGKPAMAASALLHAAAAILLWCWEAREQRVIPRFAVEQGVTIVASFSPSSSSREPAVLEQDKLKPFEPERNDPAPPPPPSGFPLDSASTSESLAPRALSAARRVQSPEPAPLSRAPGDGMSPIDMATPRNELTPPMTPASTSIMARRPADESPVVDAQELSATGVPARLSHRPRQPSLPATSMSLADASQTGPGERTHPLEQPSSAATASALTASAPKVEAPTARDLQVVKSSPMNPDNAVPPRVATVTVDDLSSASEPLTHAEASALSRVNSTSLAADLFLDAANPPSPGPARVTPKVPDATKVMPVPLPPRSATSTSGVAADEPPRKLPINRPPSYPLDALQAGLEGRVMIRVRIGVTGRAEAATIAASSGSRSLDEAALMAVRGWRFEPARRRGVPVPDEVLVPVRFSIRRG